jgi:hypothetical protein
MALWLHQHGILVVGKRSATGEASNAACPDVSAVFYGIPFPVRNAGDDPHDNHPVRKEISPGRQCAAHFPHLRRLDEPGQCAFPQLPVRTVRFVL